MQYRVKEVIENGKSFYYPQYKKRWLWRRFVWWGGEDGTTPYTVFYTTMEAALQEIEIDKENRKQKTLEKPKQVVYHPVH